MKTWKRFGTGAMVAFGLATLAMLGSASSVRAANGDSCTVNANRCSVVCTDSSDSCTLNSEVVCNGESLGALADKCAFWQVQMKRDNDTVCVQDTDLSAHNPKLSLPIKTGLGTDTVCVGGVTIGDGVSSGGWMTIRSEDGDDNIDVGDCSCNGAVGNTEVYGFATIATGRGNDTVTVDNATFHREVSIRVGSGADNVTVSDATLDDGLEILAGTNPENTDVDTVTVDGVGFGGEVLIRVGGGYDSVILDDIFCEGTDLPIEVDCGANGGTLTCSGVDTTCIPVVDTDCCDIINVSGSCSTVGC